jgi:hypothetical protein
MTDRPDPPTDPRDRDVPPGDVERVRRRFRRAADPRDDDDDPSRGLDRERSAAFGGRIRELTGAIEAPPALRRRVEEERAPRPRRRRIAIPAVAAGAVAAAAVVVALLVGGGGAGPTVDDAAALALARPTQPAPAVDTTDTHLVDARVGGIQFPNYAYTWARWKAVGRRSDTIAGRAATTVTYRGPQGDVGYTIVDGEPLPEPSGARHRTVEGLRLAVVRKGDATVVTWRRDGHTCVLAGRAKGIEARLVAFATWA